MKGVGRKRKRREKKESRNIRKREMEKTWEKIEREREMKFSGWLRARDLEKYRKYRSTKRSL